MANKDTSKQWFETGDFPTQVQFAQVFEWLRWKDEALGIGDITGLTAALNAAGLKPEKKTKGVDGWLGNYDVEPGYELYKIILVPTADCNPYAQFSGGSGDIIPLDLSTTVGVQGTTWLVNIFNATIAKTVEVVNLPSGSDVYFYKQKVI